MSDDIAAFAMEPGFDGRRLGVSLPNQGTVRLHVGPRRRVYDIDVAWLWEDEDVTCAEVTRVREDDL